MACVLQLKNGGSSILDDDDIDRAIPFFNRTGHSVIVVVAKRSWRLHQPPSWRSPYVYSSTHVGLTGIDRRHLSIPLHRVIARAPVGMHVDHINGTESLDSP